MGFGVPHCLGLPHLPKCALRGKAATQTVTRMSCATSGGAAQLSRSATAMHPVPQASPARTPEPVNPLLSVAPMMDWTDTHYRQLARLLSRKTVLWTEMVVDKTVIHTNQLDKFLWFPPEQHPIVCQLGGSDPATLEAAARLVATYGYDEINLNCGCPSDRVAGAGCFGAALMLQPERVAECMAAIARGAAGIPVTVKCRLGVDQVDTYEAVHNFVRIVSEGSPVRHFIIHARKCFLHGLNPHQNRTVPPLHYEWVYGLKRDFPHLTFSLNGGIQGAYEARAYLDLRVTPAGQQQQQQQQGSSLGAQQGTPSDTPAEQQGSTNGSCSTRQNTAEAAATDDTPAAGATTAALQIQGVMIGRQAYNDPWGTLSDADRAIYQEPSNPAVSRRQVLEEYSRYADAQCGRWAVKADGHRDPSVRTLMKPILNLFHAEKGSKKWKAAVDELLKSDPPSVSWVLAHSLAHLPDEVLDAPPRLAACSEAAARGALSAAPQPQINLPRLPVPSDRCCTANERAKQARKMQQVEQQSQESQAVAMQGSEGLPALACRDRDTLVAA